MMLIDRRADYLTMSKTRLVQVLEQRKCRLKYMMMRTKQDLVEILYKLDCGMEVAKVEDEYRIGYR